MRSSADDALTQALADTATAVEEAVAGISMPVVVIDGRSGSGKSTLASHLVTRLGAHLVALDEFYPGWDGLAAGARIAREEILQPLRADGRARWRTWDWSRDVRGPWREIVHDAPIVLEGCGALTPGIVDLADVTVWLDAPAAVRRVRALQRDGEAYRPYWERWAAQEEEHIAAHRPEAYAMISTQTG